MKIKESRSRENEGKGTWIVSNSSEQRRRDLFLREFFLLLTSVRCRESDTTSKKTKGIRISRANWTITYIPISTCVLEDEASSVDRHSFPARSLLFPLIAIPDKSIGLSNGNDFMKWHNKTYFIGSVELVSNTPLAECCAAPKESSDHIRIAAKSEAEDTISILVDF